MGNCNGIEKDDWTPTGNRHYEKILLEYEKLKEQVDKLETEKARLEVRFAMCKRDIHRVVVICLLSKVPRVNVLRCAVFLLAVFLALSATTILAPGGQRD